MTRRSLSRFSTARRATTARDRTPATMRCILGAHHLLNCASRPGDPLQQRFVSVEPAPPGCAAGSWPPEHVERRLNAGEAIAWDLPHFAVSLPLAPRLWLEVLTPGRCAWNGRASRLPAGVTARAKALRRRHWPARRRGAVSLPASSTRTHPFPESLTATARNLARRPTSCGHRGRPRRRRWRTGG